MIKSFMLVSKHWRSGDIIWFLRSLRYTDHKALQYLGSQHKLNQRDMKWVEYLQSFTFVIKHKSRVTNRVVDALSRRHSFLIEMKFEVLGFDEMNELYDVDSNFSEVWRECRASNLTKCIANQPLCFSLIRFNLIELLGIHNWINLNNIPSWMKYSSYLLMWSVRFGALHSLHASEKIRISII